MSWLVLQSHNSSRVKWDGAGVRRNEPRLGWRAAVFVVLAAGLLLAGAASSGASVSGRSVVYALVANGYNCTLTVSGDSFSGGTVACAGISYTNRVTSGTIVPGKSVKFELDCSAVGPDWKGCGQTYISTKWDGTKYIGTFMQTGPYPGGPYSFTLTPPKPPTPLEDTEAPVVKPRVVFAAKRGKTVRLRYRIDDNTGWAASEITVLQGRKIIARWRHGNQMLQPYLPGETDWENWKVPKKIKVPPPLSFCVRAWDKAGNESKSCRTITLRG